jgi:hypothetical protein
VLADEDDREVRGDEDRVVRPPQERDERRLLLRAHVGGIPSGADHAGIFDDHRDGLGLHAAAGIYLRPQVALDQVESSSRVAREPLPEVGPRRGVDSLSDPVEVAEGVVMSECDTT